MRLKWRIRVGTIVTALSIFGPGCGIDFGQLAEFQRDRQELFLPLPTDASLPIPLPVIFVPGIKGTELVRCKGNTTRLSHCEVEEEVWGTSGNVSTFRQFNDLYLDYRMTLKDEDFDGSDTIPDPTYYRDRRIRERDVLYKYKLGYRSYIPLLDLGNYDVYHSLREFLVTEGRFELDKNSFFFPYDWRLDNRIAAVKLAIMIDTYRDKYEDYIRSLLCLRNREQPCTKDEAVKYLTELRQRRPDLFTRDDKIKFILVAHSMGGLVGRYFVSALGGDRDVHKLVLLGTPIYGSVDALKALHEGDFPETFLGHFGIRWFNKDATRPIEFSFPSLFQLLPSYAGSVAGEDLRNLGLRIDQDLGEFEDETDNKIYTTYSRAKFIPGRFRLDFARDYERMNEPEYYRLMKRHLLANLRSAHCFKKAMRIFEADDERYAADVEKCNERLRVKAAEKFLRETNSDLATLAKNIVGEMTTARKKDQKIRMIIFAGHCQNTVVQAKFKNGSVEFVDDPSVSVAADGFNPTATSKQYGDGRVSVFGSGVLNPKLADANFFLCEDHVGLVKNDIFRYNLLRELLIN